MQPFTVSVKGKGRKPDRKAYPLPYGLRNPYKNLRFSGLRTLKIMPRNLNELSLKGQCHVSPKPLRKFLEIFAAQGLPPVSTTPMANAKNHQS
jgi:hypothetical protein